MPDRKLSRTALGVAYVRAAHQLLDAPPRILEDPATLTLLGKKAALRIVDSATAYQTHAMIGLRAHVALRSRYAEDRLASAIARGVRQCIQLGAGFDTFALRQPEWARELQIIEVDHPGTQNAKREMIAEAGLTLPSNVRFASVDFEKESLCDALRRHGVACDQPSFFSWLGVTMYLDDAAIDAVLSATAAFPEGSEIVLTFVQPHGDSPSPFEQRAATEGEPWLSHFTPEAMALKLRGAGFSRVEFLLPEDARERYFRGSRLPPPKRVNIASAIR